MLARRSLAKVDGPSVDETERVPVAEPWLCADGVTTLLGVAKRAIYASISDKCMRAHGRANLRKFQISEVDDSIRGGRAVFAPETVGA